MSFHLYAIQELFSNNDGTVQFIELAVGPFNGESLWLGQAISASRSGQPTHQFIFPSNLPSSLTAGTTVLVATQGFADLGLVTPDYIVPNGFLYSAGGTVNFANADSVSHAALPGDGVHSVNRNGVLANASPRNFDGDSAVLEATHTVTGTDAPEPLDGTGAADTLMGMGGNDTLRGDGGNDRIDGGPGTDTAWYTGTRASVVLSHAGSAVIVADSVAGRDGTDTLLQCELLSFSDRTVDLGMGARASAISPATLKTLEELYVGFFNRIPEAQGLGYWIDQVAAGMGLETVADAFYAAGVQFGVYSATLTDEQFIARVYDYVLGRPAGSDNAPDAEEIGYWNDLLDIGEETEGTMVLQMLGDTHAFFENSAEYGFVARHLNNKALVANYYAVQQGLSMNVQADNIAFGTELATLITPDDTTAAIAFIGVNPFSTL